MFLKSQPRCHTVARATSSEARAASTHANCANAAGKVPEGRRWSSEFPRNAPGEGDAWQVEEPGGIRRKDRAAFGGNGTAKPSSAQLQAR